MRKAQRRLNFAKSWFLAVLVILGSLPVQALQPRQYTVEVTALAQTSPPQIRLQWPLTADAAEYRVFRKAKGAANWSQLATLSGRATGFVDSNVALVNAYEYEIVQIKNFAPYPNGSPADWVFAHGYIYAGLSAPLQGDRGKALLVVDTAIAAAIEAELRQFTRNLSGDGWTVETIFAHRSDTVPSVKQKIREAADRDPRTRSVFLIGHVPVPYSGDIYPDLHRSHQGAWPADGYYGELDGNWTDGIVWRTDTEDPRNDNIHGDGKFDQSTFPSDVDLEVGRVDFYDLDIDGRTEIELLRQYFRKNHNYRHKVFSLPNRGLIRDNFGETGGDAPAASGWRAFVPMFGRANVVEVAPNDYFPRLSWDGFLWSFGAGGGTYDHADGVGYTPDFYRRDPKTVFAILHGSYFGDWDSPNNFLRGALAAPTYTLAAIWAGLPHWFMHHMALGETLGYSTRLAQNNWDTYKSQVNLARRQAHISLIGDPTLRMHMMAPPSNLRGTVGAGVTLSWSPSPDANLGYQIYRGTEYGKPFVRLNRSAITGTTYTDAAYPGGAQIYMVRAYALQDSPSGSFYNASTGIFWSTEGDEPPPPPPLPTVTITATDALAHEDGPDQATLTLSRSGALTSPLTVTLTASGSATIGADVEMISLSPTFAAGQASLAITVTPRPDELVEGEETLTLTIAPSALYHVGATSSATVRIGDKIIPPSITQVTVQTNGSTKLVFRGAPGASCRLESSADFKAWSKVADVKLSSTGQGEYAITPSGRARFYRLAVN